MRQLLSLTLSLVPAAYVWFSGRELIRRIDDPLFPELRFVKGQRMATVFAVTVVVAVLLSPGMGPGLLLLAGLTALAANYPARRRILDESWGLASYLAHTSRVWIATLGVWLVLAFTPAILSWAGPDLALPLGAGLIVLVLAWGRAHAIIAPLLLGGRPLDRPGLETRFEEVLSRARCRRPRVYEVGASGGRWVNGFAVPSLFRPSILLTTGLLDELTPGEASAIFAHEVAHLEYFEGRRIQLREIMAVIAGIALLAIVLWLEPGSEGFAILTWAWPAGMLLILLHSSATNQAREHESDLRAVELVGDAELVVAALTKIHTIMQLPRRWQASAEAKQSHPSLARRLRAIRSAGVETPDDTARGAAEDTEEMEAVLLRDADDASTALLLDGDRLCWLEGLPEEAALPDPRSALSLASAFRGARYAELADLRLNIDGGARYVSVLDAEGGVSRLRLAPGDVAQAKAVLERVEDRVGTRIGARASQRALRAGRTRRARIWSIAAAIAALLPPLSFPLALMAGLAVWRPSVATMAGAGAMALGAATLPALSGGLDAISAVLLVAIAAMLLIEARAWGRLDLPDPPGVVRITLLVLGGMAALYVLRGVGRLEMEMPASQLHLWIRAGFGAALVFVGMAAVLLSLGRRRLRFAAAGCLALGVLASLPGSGWFAARFGEDPMGISAPVSRVIPVEPELVREVDLSQPAMELEVAPNGRRIAARVGSSGPGDRPFGSYQVELASGDFMELAAVDLAFTGDDGIAYLVHGDGQRLILEGRRLDGRDPEWRIPLPPLSAPSLTVDPRIGAWQVVSFAEYGDGAVLLNGRLGSTEFQMREWTPEGLEGAYPTALQAGADGRALAILSRYSSLDYAGPTAMLASFGFFDHRLTNELWSIGGATSRRLLQTTAWLTCGGAVAESRAAFCLSSQGTSPTGLWRVDTGTGTVARLATLPGQVSQIASGAGERFVAWTWFQFPLLVDGSTGRVWELRTGISVREEAAGTDLSSGLDRGPVDRLYRALWGPEDGIFHRAVAVEGSTLAVATDDGQRARVAIYRLPE